MPKVVLLDTGPLGMVSHPRANREIAEWLKSLLMGGVTVLVPEIADYEVRRELIRANKSKGIERLNELKNTLVYLPLSTAAMLKAAEFWALARNTGRPTASDDSLDGDMILAGQAATRAGSVDDETVIATTNPKHLAIFAHADVWSNIG